MRASHGVRGGGRKRTWAESRNLFILSWNYFKWKFNCCWGRFSPVSCTGIYCCRVSFSMCHERVSTISNSTENPISLRVLRNPFLCYCVAHENPIIFILLAVLCVRVRRQCCDKQHRLICSSLMLQRHEQNVIRWAGMKIFNSSMMAGSFPFARQSWVIWVMRKTIELLAKGLGKEFVWRRSKGGARWGHEGKHLEKWGGRLTVDSRKAISTWIYNDADT